MYTQWQGRGAEAKPWLTALYMILQLQDSDSLSMEEEIMVCGKIDWEKVNAALPYKRGEDQLEERRKLWRAIDVSGSGLLSLAKVIF